MAIRPPAGIFGPPAWTPLAVGRGPLPVGNPFLPGPRPPCTSATALAASGATLGWFSDLWRWRPWKTAETPPPPTPVPPAPPTHALSPDVVRFADRTVLVDLSQVDHRVTLEFRRALCRGVQITRQTLTIRVPDPKMAEHHATVHSIPEQRLMVVHDHGSPLGTIMGGKKLFLEPQFLPLSPGSIGVTLRLADTTVVIGQPKHLAPPTEAAYDLRTGMMRIALGALTEAAAEALRLPETSLQIALHRLADDTLVIRAVPAAEGEAPTWHGALDIGLPDEEYDLAPLKLLLSFVAGHLRVFRPVSQPTTHVALEWLPPTDFADRMGPWVMEGTIAEKVRKDGLIIFLSRGKEDSTDGFSWVVQPDGTAGTLTDNDLMDQEGHSPKVILLLPWHDLPRARTQLARAIARIRSHMEHARITPASLRHVQQIFASTLIEHSAR